MSETSRRKFIAAAGVSAAAGTAALMSTAGSPAAAARPSARSATGPVLVVVQPGSDRVELLVGEREVVVSDRDLATRIRNAAGGE